MFLYFFELFLLLNIRISFYIPIKSVLILFKDLLYLFFNKYNRYTSYSLFPTTPYFFNKELLYFLLPLAHFFGGGERVRTDDPLLAKQVLSQLSYTPS